MYRIASFVMIGLGLLVAILGFTGILPQMGGSGVFLLFVGLLVLGLSFIPLPEKEEGVEESSLLKRLVDVFVSPGELFRNTRSFPSYLGVVILLTVFAGGYTFLFVERITPERIADHVTDSMEESGFVPAEQLPEVRKTNLEANTLVTARIGGFLSQFSFLLLLIIITGGIMFLAALVMGAKINFLQALAVAAFSFVPIFLLRSILSTIVLFLTDPLDLHPIRDQQTLLPDNLSVLVSAADGPLLFSVLSMFSLLWIYWIVLAAIGIKEGSTKGTMAAGLVGSVLIWGIGLVVAVIFGSLFGGMIS